MKEKKFGIRGLLNGSLDRLQPENGVFPYLDIGGLSKGIPSPFIFAFLWVIHEIFPQDLVFTNFVEVTKLHNLGGQQK